MPRKGTGDHLDGNVRLEHSSAMRLAGGDRYLRRRSESKILVDVGTRATASGHGEVAHLRGRELRRGRQVDHDGRLTSTIVWQW